MKILLLGGYGLLGNAIYLNFVQSGFDVYRFSKSEIDLLDRNSLNKINELKPDVIVHAAGYTNVDQSEIDISKPIDINCSGMYNLINSIEEQNVPIVYFSTDYVFDGQSNSPYKENDKSKPINKYGLSKIISEDILRANYSNYYIIRTSWLFGEHGKCFPKTILQKCKEQHEINVVIDQIGAPTYTKDLAESVKQILIQEIPYGTYHITNDGETSWYELASIILKLSGITGVTINKISTKDLLMAANRPKYSKLSNEKINSFGIYNRHFKSAIEEFINNME